MTALGKGDTSLDFSGGLCLDRRKVAVVQHTGFAHPRSQPIDRIAMFPFLDLCPLAVELWVEHRMRPEAIGSAFEERGPGTPADSRADASGRGFHSNDVHAVDDFRRDIVALRLDVDVGLRFRALEPRPHRVEIVLTDE